MVNSATPNSAVMHLRTWPDASVTLPLLNESGSGPLRTPNSVLRSLWRHRALIRQFAWREFRSRYMGSQLGLFWSVLTPAWMLAVYTFVFRGILHVQWNTLPNDSAVAFAVNLFGGLLVYNLFAEVVSKSPQLLISHPQFVKKVVFPLEILPVTTTAAALGHGLVALTVVGVAAAVLVRAPGWNFLWLPVVLLPYLALLLGVSWFLAALGAFWRDVGPAVTIGLHALIFLTPVFYPLDTVPRKCQVLLRLNPLATFVENTRRVWLSNRPPLFGAWVIASLLSLGVMLAGYWWFEKSKRAFADVV